MSDSNDTSAIDNKKNQDSSPDSAESYLSKVTGFLYSVVLIFIIILLYFTSSSLILFYRQNQNAHLIQVVKQVLIQVQFKQIFSQHLQILKCQ